MPKKTLNALFVEYAKPDPSRVIDYSDQEIDSYGAMRRGFLFRVSPRGMKSWVARLKYNDGPKKGYYYEKKIGEWPGMKLAEARKTFDQYVRLDRRGLAVSRGGDGLVFTSHRGLVDESTHDAATGL